MRETRTRRRRSAALWTGLLLAGAAAAIPAGSASAAASVGPRPTPAAAPTDRVMEMVSPVEKHGAPIYHVRGVADNEDGGVLFQAHGAFGDVLTNTLSTFYRARRGATGWDTTGMQPRPTGRASAQSDHPYFTAADPQLDSMIELSNYPFVAGVPEIARGVLPKVYRVGAHGAVSWLSSDTLAPSGIPRAAVVASASRDTERLLLMGYDAAGGPFRLYVRSGDRTVPVGIDPEGTPLETAYPAGHVGVGLGPAEYTLAPRAMSDDGQTVAFSPEGGQLNVRRNALRSDADTVIADRSRRSADPAGTVCAANGFIGVSSDGRRVLFSCASPLTEDAPADGVGVYEFDPVADELHYRGATQELPTLIGADRDLRRLYLLDAGDLVTLDSDGPQELVPDVGTSSVAVSRDGMQLAFLSDQGLDGGYGGLQMYVYDATGGGSGSLTCVSCRANGSSGGTASFGTADIAEYGVAPRGGPMDDSFTADGAFFFMSTASLAPGAPEGPASVYEFRNGEVRLLVAGSEQGDARFAGASPDGTDVFVQTQQSLLPQDGDYPVADLYDFRRGGGFPPEPECTDCTPAAPPDLGRPGSDSPIGSQQEGPPSVGVRSPLPVATPKPRIVSRRAKGLAVTVRVRVPVAGTLRVTGSGLRGASRRVTRAGTYAVTARLSSYGRRTLSRTGRLRVRPRVRWAPQGGAASDVRTTLTIKRTTRKAA